MAKSRGNIQKITDIWLLIIFIPLYLLAPLGADAWVIWPCLAVAYYYAYQIFKKPLSIYKDIKTYFKVETFFFIFYYILFYYPYQSYVLGNFDISTVAVGFGNPYIEYTNPSILLSTIGLISFMLGLKLYKPKKKKKKQENVFNNIYFSKRYANSVLILLLIISVFLLLMFSQSDAASNMLMSAYTGSVSGDVNDDGVYFIISLIATLNIGFVIVYLLQFKKISPLVIMVSIIPVLWMIVLFLSGDRNMFFILALAIVGGYYTFFKSIGIKRLSLYAFAAYLIFIIGGITRQLSEKSFSSFIENIHLDAIFEDSLEEGQFATTTITSRAAFAVVEEKQGYFYGKFFVAGAMGIIPYSRGLFYDRTDREIASSRVLGDEMLRANSGWGVGSNVISDIYLQFGMIGVVLFMTLLGWYGSKATRNVMENSDSYIAIIIYIVTLSLYAEISRYSITFPIRNLIWSYWLFKIFEFLLQYKQSKSQYVRALNRLK